MRTAGACADEQQQRADNATQVAGLRGGARGGAGWQQRDSGPGRRGGAVWQLRGRDFGSCAYEKQVGPGRRGAGGGRCATRASTAGAAAAAAACPPPPPACCLRTAHVATRLPPGPRHCHDHCHQQCTHARPRPRQCMHAALQHCPAHVQTCTHAAWPPRTPAHAPPPRTPPPPPFRPTWFAAPSTADLMVVGNSSEAKVMPSAQADEHPNLPSMANSTCARARTCTRTQRSVVQCGHARLRGLDQG